MDQHSRHPASDVAPGPLAAIGRSVAVLSSSLDAVLAEGEGIARSIDDCYQRLTRVRALLIECLGSGEVTVASTARLLEPLVSGLVELTETVAHGAVAELARSADELEQGLATIKAASERAPVAVAKHAAGVAVETCETAEDARRSLALAPAISPSIH